jgi:radical SAM superfamily enzyme YgiQ (UPF0313 family)
MRVLLANPPWIFKGNYGVRATSRWPHLRKDKVIPFPIFHAYAAAVLEKNGISVKAIDAVQQEMDIESFVAEVEKYNPDFLFMETSTPSYNFDKRTAQAIKLKVDTKIGMFGPHATIYDRHILEECPAVDIIVRGEYDYTLLDIVREKDLKIVKGITFRTNKNIVRTDDRMLISDLDKLPFPARHLYPQGAYEEPIYKRPNFLMSTSRGCPYGCSFCLWPATMYGKKFRTRSVQSVIDEIVYLVEEYGAKSINFDDDTFTLNKRRVIEICDELIRLGLNKKIVWYCYSSTNVDDPELYKRMAEAGCEMVKFGVESASDVALKKADKHLTINQVRKGFKIAKDAGIKTFGTFTFGLPGETKESINETIKLSIELEPFAVQYSYVVPFPGTRLYEDAKRNGWLVTDEWDGFAGSQKPIMIPDGVSKEDLQRAVVKAHRAFYLRASYAWKLIKDIRDLSDLTRLILGAYSMVKRFVFYRGNEE